MTVSAWRICKRKHRDTAFSGDGARLFGGRWNRPGTSVVYVAGSVSLAALEMLVHLDNAQILDHYLLTEIRFADTLMTELTLDDLPHNWRESPPPDETQSLGDSWVESNKCAVLRVPSSVVENEYNFVLNPSHPDFSLIEILAASTFQFDRRLADLKMKRAD